MSEMSAKERNSLDRDQFAYIDSEGGEHLPIHDEDHVRNAVQRFGQTDFESEQKKQQAAQKVLDAADDYGIEVSEDDDVVKAAK